MTVRSRQTKVFAALLVSIAVGAIILKVLGNNPPSAGAFCLSRYYHLDPIEKSILSQATQYPGRWSHIKIYYSIFNCHFIICNGHIGHDGQILPTEDWQKQCPIIPEPNSILDSEQTIYIGVITDDEATRPTDFQIRRTEALVEALSRKFNIRPEFIHYPDNWQ